MPFYRYDGIVRNAIGEAVPDVKVYVCTQPATTNVIPPSPLATLYSNSTGTPLANPVIVDGNGNFFFYATTGLYTLVFFDSSNRIPTQAFIDQIVETPGAGTVTSVALSMPAEFTVAGSPIITNGSFAVTKANQNAHMAYMGPASGPAAPPAFRALVSGDFPAGVGTVTSVALTFTPSALFSSSVAGSPINSTGTLAITLGLANQSPHTFLAGPASGVSIGPVTARVLVPGDMPGQVAVTFSATPVFDASLGGSFTITLTGDVTSSSVTNPTAGAHITFVITQDGTGSHAFTWPTNFKGANAIAPEANMVSVQSFIYAGTVWRAIAPGMTMSA